MKRRKRRTKHSQERISFQKKKAVRNEEEKKLLTTRPSRTCFGLFVWGTDLLVNKAKWLVVQKTRRKGSQTEFRYDTIVTFTDYSEAEEMAETIADEMWLEQGNKALIGAGIW